MIVLFFHTAATILDFSWSAEFLEYLFNSSPCHSLSVASLFDFLLIGWFSSDVRCGFPGFLWLTPLSLFGIWLCFCRLRFFNSLILLFYIICRAQQALDPYFWFRPSIAPPLLSFFRISSLAHLSLLLIWWNPLSIDFYHF